MPLRNDLRDEIRTRILWVQGLYYVASAIWPLVHASSFAALTRHRSYTLTPGQENTHRLIMTVALLTLAVGCTLLTAAWRRSRAPEIALLATLAAAGLMSIEVLYVARRVISPIYLADVVVELVAIAGWLTILVMQIQERLAGSTASDRVPQVALPKGLARS